MMIITPAKYILLWFKHIFVCFEFLHVSILLPEWIASATQAVTQTARSHHNCFYAVLFQVRLSIESSNLDAIILKTCSTIPLALEKR
jgi:hypothetical protein